MSCRSTIAITLTFSPTTSVDSAVEYGSLADGTWTVTLDHTKITYDGDFGYTAATNLTGDTVLEQSETIYDANSNVIKNITKQRLPDASGTGALGTASSGVHARVSYSGSYYDGADRPITSIDVGTNAGSSWTRPSSVSDSANNRSDTVLRSDVSYDVAGRTYETTDPKGLINRTLYDAMGRTAKTIQNYINGTVSDADDKTTEYTYGPAGMKTLKAYTTSSTSQTTEWVYGVATSTLYSNDIGSETKWPDASTGAASGSEKDVITVNALGQTLTRTDRNGNVHTYTYDVLGRVTVDAVTTLGSGIDGSVRRIETAYDGQGNAYLITSYNASTSGSIVNQVQREFNGLGQLITEYQSHSGAVNTSTTPKVQYGYSEMASGANHSRMTSLTYPNGRVISYIYDSGLDDAVSRLTSMTDSSTTLESYTYMGAGTVVTRAHPQPGVNLTYITSSTGDAGEYVGGLDRFGRVVDQNWKTSGGTVKDRYQYTYDRDGNRLTKDNLVESDFDEVYTYDGLNQISTYEQGTTSTQEWDYDGLGNWDSVTTDGGSPQTRSHNAQNEITSVSGATSPTFDANGNMTKDETNKRYAYDAWNKLVAVKNSSDVVIASYTYDGRGYRISETASSTTKDLYYSAGWQVLEERVSGTAVTQYVWSPVYVDAMVVRYRSVSGTLDERVWPVQDANLNVTVLLNDSGSVLERYTYTPFGVVSLSDSSYGILTSSSYSWDILWQGMKWNTASGSYKSRGRSDISPTLGRPSNRTRYCSRPMIQTFTVGRQTGPLTDSIQAGLKVYVVASNEVSNVSGSSTGSSTFFHVSIVVTDCVKVVKYDGNGPVGSGGQRSIVYSALESGLFGVVGLGIRFVYGTPTVSMGTNTEYRTPIDGKPEPITADMTGLIANDKKAVLVNDGKFEEEVAAMNKAFDSMKQVDVYNAIEGPNSNTFAHQLLINAGYTPPELPFIAPAYDYSGENRYGGPNYDEKGNCK